MEAVQATINANRKARAGNQFVRPEQDEQDGVGCYLGRNDLWGMGEHRSDFNIGKSVIREPMQK